MAVATKGPDKVKVKLVCGLAFSGRTHQPGDIVEVAPEEAKRLIKRGSATPVQAEKLTAARTPEQMGETRAGKTK